MEAKHLDDKLSHGHIDFKGYYEVAMDPHFKPKIKFEGEDGYHWNMSEECILAIRRCSALKFWSNTKGSCRPILDTDRGLPRVRGYMSYSGIQFGDIPVVFRVVEWESGKWMADEVRKMQSFYYLPAWMQNAILKIYNMSSPDYFVKQAVPDFSVWWEVASMTNIKDPAKLALEVLFPKYPDSEATSLSQSQAETSQADISTMPSCEFSFESDFEKKLRF
ncbi:hypothetical protein TWF694_002150 [Orbilia ellipsospora]|uniref:Uncharacterized protein n=1 Tax=Orbilia ellipsospora TaxID=2528407 RepID=A0AAV9X512_9PEZI